MPHDSVDPVVISSHIINGIQNIVSRQKNPFDPVVITVGSIHGGNLPNIIPETVRLTGTIRTYSIKGKNECISSLKRITNNIAKAFNAGVKINWIEGYPAVINTAKEVKIVQETAKSVLGNNSIKKFRHSMGAEDFAYFLKKCPGAMFKLGMNEPSYIYRYPHTGKFDFNDNALKYGILMMSSIAVKYLNGKI